jgi:adenosylmethionine-8-amino-7-oxononanoate aminotransferase
MAGGYAPVAAVLLAERVWNAFLGDPEERKEFHHGHTFGGNPIACAAGVATLRQIQERHLVENAQEQGAHLRHRLEAMAQQFHYIGDVRGAGLLQGMEFVADRATHTPFAPSVRPGKLLEKACKDRGLILRTGNDFAVFAPPLVVTRADIDEMTDIFEDALWAVAPALPSAAGAAR